MTQANLQEIITRHALSALDSGIESELVQKLSKALKERGSIPQEEFTLMAVQESMMFTVQFVTGVLSEILVNEPVDV